MIYCLRSFRCPSFSCHFHLWGFGGPSWIREYNLWLYELEHEWTTVSRSPPGHLTGANSVPIGAQRSPNPPSCSTLAAINNIPSSSDHVPTASGIISIQNSIPRDPTTRPTESPQPTTTPHLTGAQPTSITNPRPNQAHFTDRGPPGHQQTPHLSICGKCLSAGHLRIDCKNQFRCRSCYRYGHTSRFCFNTTLQKNTLP